MNYIFHILLNLLHNFTNPVQNLFEKQFYRQKCFYSNIGEPGRKMVSNLNQQYNNIPMQAVNGQTIPVNIDKEKIKEGVDNSYLANRVKASSDEETNPLLYAGTGAAIWYGIAQGMDVFNKSCATDYDKSAFGKLGAFGDKIANSWNNTAVGRFFNNIFGKGKDFGHWMTTKSDIAYSLANHSTQPEWHFAKTPASGVHGFLAMDMQQVFDEYLKPISENSNKLSWIVGKDVNPQRLEQYGMSQADIDTFRKGLKGKSFAEKQVLLQKKELELLGYKHDFIEHVFKSRGREGLEKIALAKKVRRAGFESVAAFNEVKKDIIANPDKVMEALERATKNGDVNVSIWRKGGAWGKFTSHMFGRQVSLKEYLNKYKAALGKGNTTSLGRALPKALAWLLEGCTNRFAGGKIAVAMQAGIFADMLIHTFKAPKGEKGKTLAERFVNDFTYFMALPLGIVAMHKVGGLKYAGMTTEQVKDYREALKQFNADVKAGNLADKNLYKQRKADLKKMLKANVKNPITKLFKKIGGFINIGNETILARRSGAKWNMNLLRKSGNFFRNLAGVPLRIAIPMMIISPFLAKLTTKGAHAIFGKPTKSVLDEDKEESKNETVNADEQKALQEALIKAAQAQAAAQKQMPQTQSNLINQYVNTHNIPTSNSTIPQNSQTNLINQYVAGNMNQSQNSAKAAPIINQTISQSQMPKPAVSQTLPDKPNVKDATLKLNHQQPQSQTLPKPPKKKRYIPSPECKVMPSVTEDYSKADAAMKKSDDVEKMVKETLSMR